MTRERMSVVAVWVAALVGVIGVGILAAPERHITWVSILMLVLICLACVLQLAQAEADGFVRRMSESLVGALVILGIASLVFVILGGDALVGVSGNG